MTTRHPPTRAPLRAVLLAAAALLFAALAGAAHAQAGQGDPPGRVARLSEFNGQAWVYSPDNGDWTSAVRNRPLTSGDRLATDPGARAELQIGSTTLRLDSGSELEVLELDDEHLALQLHNGSVTARVRDLESAGEIEVLTDEGRFVIRRAGSYRFDRRDAKSDVTVYAGLARYEGPNSGLAVNAGQRAQFWIDSGGVAQYSLGSPLNDAFAGWARDRDRAIGTGATARYVSPEMTGADELDRYGRWEQSPDYGALWIPTVVAVDWAPYSRGHWAWVLPWGWTWVDDAPWGFAPFHYGRWVYVRNNWCWTPGTRVRHPVYAPALVAWIGGPRGNVSVSIGGGPAVGWFPLAPREVYVPSYRVSSRYAQNINITHVTNVAQISNVINNPQQPRTFENRRFPRAITVVPAGVLTERQPVGPAAAQMRQAPWVRDFANQSGRTDRALLAPPVSAPTPLARSADPSAVRAPPGGAERPAINATRPGFGPRERDDANQRRGRAAERDGTMPPNARQVAPAAVAPPPVVIQTAPPAGTQTAPAPITQTGPARGNLPPAAPQFSPRPGVENADRRAQPGPGLQGPRDRGDRGDRQDPGDRGDRGDRADRADRGDRADRVDRVDRGARGNRPESAPVAAPPVVPAPLLIPTPAAPQVVPPAVLAPAPLAVPQAPQAPMMRPLPVQRGEARRDDAGGDERRGAERRVGPPPRPEAPTAAPVAEPARPAQRVERVERVERAAPPAALVAPRPVEVPQPARPVEVQRPARPVEVQRPSRPVEVPSPARPIEVQRPAPAAVAPPLPAPAAEARRNEPRGRGEAKDEQRRGEPRDPQREQTRDPQR